MHMADALVAPVVAGGMYACSTVAMGYSIKKLKIQETPKKVAVMGVMGAFVFATQMINFTIPGTGSSGHLCGGMLLSAILGPEVGFLTMIGVLLIQCLMFGDGGIMALGCNIWNMAFYGCFIGAMVIWRLVMKNGINKKKITFAAILGCIVTLQLGAFSVSLETLASGITELPFSVFVATMQPIHLAIGLVEGLITSEVLCFVYEARPELLWNYSGNKMLTEKKAKMSYKGVIVALVAMAIVIGGLVSLVASSNPDGLEWSIEKLTGSTDVAASGKIYDGAASLQNFTAILPDYGFKGSDSVLGTSFSGIIGCIVVVALCVVICYAIKFFKRKRNNE